jgi:hypothetical protein
LLESLGGEFRDRSGLMEREEHRTTQSAAEDGLHGIRESAKCKVESGK